MIHVMNPYQLSTSMYRLAAYSWGAQVAYLKAVSHLASFGNPMAVTREMILKRQAPEPVAPAVEAPKKAPAQPRAARAIAQSKPAVKPTPTAPVQTKTAPAKPTPAAPAVVAAKPTLVETAPAPVAADAPADAKRYREPSTPPAMPQAKVVK